MLAPHPTRVPLPATEVTWYRTKLPPDVSARLHTLSDVKAAAQTLSFLGQLAIWGVAAVYFSVTGHPYAALAFLLLYGMQANFLINAMHELGHGSVFRTAWLNHFFLRVVSFLGWLHPDLFFSSHLRHHRYTQHGFPLDMENPMPIVITLNDFLGFGFINVRGFVDIVMRQTLFAALGIFPTGHLGWRPEWEAILYPDAAPHERDAPIVWARVLVIGHLAIAAASISRGLYLVPIIVSFGPFLNGWLFFLCNATQHVGLHPKVNDFRLNSRTFYVNNWLVAHWYWMMNWHTEHHMYSAVPCYNLAALHEAIRHDLPPAHNGIAAVWRVIVQDLRRQARDLSFVEEILLPKQRKVE